MPDSEKFNKYLLISQVSIVLFDKFFLKRGSKQKERMVFLYFYFTYLEYRIEIMERKTIAQSHPKAPTVSIVLQQSRYKYRFACPMVELESGELKADEDILR